MNLTAGDRLKIALRAMFQQFGKSENEFQLQAARYLECLADQPIDIVEKSIFQARKTLRFLPTVADILEPLTQANEARENQEWYAFKEYFAANSSNNRAYLPIPGDVYAIKKKIGVDRIDRGFEDDWVWIWKEVEAIWRDNKKMGRLDQLSLPDPMASQYKPLPSGGSYLPPKQVGFSKSFSSIGKLVKETRKI
jgi:hypothetical protein